MRFLADLHTLGEIMEHIQKEASKSGMEEKALHKLELACEEAIVNIVSYAYPEQKGPIEVVCSVKGHRFEILLRDWGVPFNPIDADLHPDIDKPVQERRIGGLGIFLIRKVIDEASYQRIENENVLRMAFVI